MLFHRRWRLRCLDVRRAARDEGIDQQVAGDAHVASHNFQLMPMRKRRLLDHRARVRNLGGTALVRVPMHKTFLIMMAH
jgi:hypothetical protein